MSSWSTTRPFCIFGALVLTRHSLDDRCAINVAKWTLVFSFCASTVTSFLLFTLSICPAGVISSFSHSLFTAAFASLFSAMRSSWFLGRVDSKRSLVDSWASTIQAYSGFLVWVSVSTRYSFPQLLKKLSCLNLAGYLSVFEHCRLLVFQLPTLVVLAFWLLLTCQSKPQATINLVWQLLGSSSSVSSRPQRSWRRLLIQ